MPTGNVADGLEIGAEMFKRFFYGVCTALLAVAMVSPTVAMAAESAPTSGPQRITSPKTIRYPKEGGTWTYGNWLFFIHSDYDHDTEAHGSSCELDGVYNSSIDTIAGEPSRSQVPCPTDFPWEGKQDSYWYRIC